VEKRVSECPELKDLARLAETGEGEPTLVGHVQGCDACREALENLEDEVMSLQISISELWFREQISCPEEAELRSYAKGGLDRDYRRYVEFHLKDLDCVRCQSMVAAAEAAADGSEEGRRRITRSRARIDDASVKLLGDLRKAPRK
jgi:hypothetical protein